MSTITATPTTVYTCPTAKVSVVESDGILSMTTPCCGASAKGSGDGVVCRSCYVEVSPNFGMAAMAGDDISGLAISFREIMAGSNCPCPEDCTTEMVARVEEREAQNAS